MKFERLQDPLIKVLFENDEIIAVDKPYGISSHTNDSKVGNEDYVQHGLIEFFESQLQRKLHIVHRLDRTTTGVIVIAKSLEAAAKFQAYFRERKTEKTYQFITRSKVEKSELSSKAPIHSKGAELEADTSFTRLTQSKAFALWEARPRTGRKHQIRIHAAALGIPLLGDEEYGGSPYPFICLHNMSIRFPGGLAVEARPPRYFNELELLDDEWLATQLFEIDRRTRLFGASAAPHRLAPEIDLFGERIVASEGGASGLARVAKELGREVVVHRKDHWVRVTASRDESKLDEGKWVVSESGVKFELRAESSASVGLYLDQRLQRNGIRDHSSGAEVLSLFAGNCTASAAAAVGGASRVTSVEMRKSALEWGRRNFEINSCLGEKYKFLCRDSVTAVQQFASKGVQFDLVLCDVPTFFRREKGVFKVEADLESFLVDAFRCLKPSGHLVLSSSSPALKIDDIRTIIESAGRSARAGRLEISSLLPSLDFALPGEIPQLKSFRVKRSD